MDSSDDAATWLQFFKNAGIPTTTAANYAILFTTHRIQIDMLNDLSRDILQAMGVTVMGDIIAILKHAKEIHAQNTREKALGSESCNSPVISTPTISTRTVKTSIKPNSGRIVPAPISKLAQVRKETATTNNNTQKKRQIISLKPTQNEEVPVVKTRRVLPEHEGPYQVKMPQGSTPKTRRMLAQQGTPIKKSSVFQRLGDPNVSSTTGSENPQFTITDFGRRAAPCLTSSNPSVFDRLGPGVDVSSTSEGEHYNDKVQSNIRFSDNTSKLGVRTVVKAGRNVSTNINNKQSNVMSRLGPCVAPVKKPSLEQESEGSTAGILSGGIKRKQTNSIQERLGVKIGGKKLTTVNKSDLQAKLASGHRIELVTKTDASGAVKRIKVLKKINQKSDVFQRLGGNN